MNKKDKRNLLEVRKKKLLKSKEEYDDVIELIQETIFSSPLMSTRLKK